MSKTDSTQFAAANSYQPTQLLTETYQPVGPAEVPAFIPPLISGVANPPVTAPQIPVATASTEEK